MMIPLLLATAILVSPARSDPCRAGPGAAVMLASVGRIYQAYARFDPSAANLVAERFRMIDFTMGLDLVGRDSARGMIGSPGSIREWRITLESVDVLCAGGVDVRGTMSGTLPRGPFSTRFNTVMMFDSAGLVRLWIDHVDPQTFTREPAGSPPPAAPPANVRVVRQMFEVLTARDDGRLVRLVADSFDLHEPLLGVGYLSTDEVVEAWRSPEGKRARTERDLVRVIQIAPDVFDVIGSVQTPDGWGRTRQTPTSTQMMLKGGKVRRVVDLVDPAAHLGL